MSAVKRAAVTAGEASGAGFEALSETAAAAFASLAALWEAIYAVSKAIADDACLCAAPQPSPVVVAA